MMVLPEVVVFVVGIAVAADVRLEVFVFVVIVVLASGFDIVVVVVTGKDMQEFDMGIDTCMKIEFAQIILRKYEKALIVIRIRFSL